MTHDNKDESFHSHSTEPDDAIVLEERTVLDGKLRLRLPMDFTIMAEDKLKLKYPSENRPSMAYTNKAGSVNVAINHTQDTLPEEYLPEFHEKVETMFQNLYPETTWYCSEFGTINGTDWFILELDTPTINVPVRNVMAFTSLEDRMLAVTFNVTKNIESEWMGAGYAIIESLELAAQ